MQPSMTSQVMRGPKVALFTVALIAAVVSSMMHLAHIEGRMTGAPKTWTAWVVVDAVLAGHIRLNRLSDLGVRGLGSPADRSLTPLRLILLSRDPMSLFAPRRREELAWASGYETRWTAGTRPTSGLPRCTLAKQALLAGRLSARAETTGPPLSAHGRLAMWRTRAGLTRKRRRPTHHTDCERSASTATRK